jgi:hypothetical protein
MCAGLSAFALVQYDRYKGSTTPDLQLLATLQAPSAAVESGLTSTPSLATLLEANFTSDESAPVSTVVPWSMLPASTSPLSMQFNVHGSGEASVSALLEFVPAELLPFPTYRGLWVESSVQLQDPVTGLPRGPILQTLPLGSVVIITIQVTKPPQGNASNAPPPLDPRNKPGAERHHY